ncbi:MAG: competence/damage-inducible protein A [Hyphomonadaceae bacterium]
MTEARPVTAAVLLIGDELLSGRTQDTNLQTIAKFVGPLGVRIAEARVVPDVEEEIAAALNTLRAKHDYVFTTGGIGPTHDDKTADSVALAFGVGIGVNEEARAILEAHYGSPSALNEARLRMARTPHGASLIANPVSRAPGFQIGNVFVMAGIPAVMRGMLQDVGPRLAGGAVLRARTVGAVGLREGEIAAPLQALEESSPGVTFGSYPFYGAEGRTGVNLVARSTDPAALAKAAAALMALVAGFGVTPEEISEA